MKILIKTLPLFSGNNGGILQALALQKAVNHLGHIAITDAPHKFKVSWRTPIRFALDVIRARGFDGVLDPISRNKILSKCSVFIEENIKTIDLFNDRKKPSAKKLGGWEMFLVGSDQVWRAKYCSVEDYFFHFLMSDPRPRVSYAASFGVDPKLEYSSKQLKEAGMSLKKFSAISVRERNGVEILEQQFDLSAVQVLDPTLLWTSEFYDGILSKYPSSSSKAFILSLFLDETVLTEKISESFSLEKSKKLVKFYTREPKNLFEFFSEPDTFTLPSPAEWLSAIKNAEFVLTDSFHATVFCIIYRVDFLVIPNESRGPDRLKSLLSDLGLSERILDNGFIPGISNWDIDWDDVEKKLKPKRLESWNFLKNSLGYKK